MHVTTVGVANGNELASLGPRPSRDSRTKEGLGTLVDFLGTPARFGMVQSDCRISLVTQLSRSNSRVTATQTPPPGHDTMRSSRITRLLLKCACTSHDLKRTKCQGNRLKFPDPLSLVEGRGLGTRLRACKVPRTICDSLSQIIVRRS